LPIHTTPRIYRCSYFFLLWIFSRTQNNQPFGANSSKEIPVKMGATLLHKLAPKPQLLPFVLISIDIETQLTQKNALKEGYPVNCLDCRFPNKLIWFIL